MIWKEQLRAVEQAGGWDFAIAFLEDVIKQDPHDMDAYIFLNFRLMYLLVEEYPYPPKDETDRYEVLAKKYFKESYAKFSNNLEYLYYTGTTAAMSEWFFDITDVERNNMIETAQTQLPEYPPIKFDYYWNLFRKDKKNQGALNYARLTLSEDSSIKKIFKTSGFFKINRLHKIKKANRSSTLFLSFVLSQYLEIFSHPISYVGWIVAGV